MDKRTFDLLVSLDKKKPLSKKQYVLLEREGYCINKAITEKGVTELEPFRVKRAIIMAAGFGSRMVPITLQTPKPLVRVHGIRFIDTLIKALINNGIDEIYIVRGYLKEKFDELLKDYPFIKFIDNDLYKTENNISSLIKAVDLIENTYICEADFLINGDDVIEKYQIEPNYLGTPVKKTDDWCFQIDNSGRVYNYKKGGKNCIQAFGISYWNRSEGIKLQKYLKQMYSFEENKQKFWEMCVFDIFKEKFDVKCRFVNKNSIQEIDSFDELVEIDSSYKK